MASIYLRGEVIWMKFKNKHGKPECRSSGHRRGQEALARELAEEVERQAKLERDRAEPEPSPSPSAPSSIAWVLPMPSVASSAPVAPVATPAERIGPDAPAGVLTVRAYAEEWLGRRVEIATARDETTRLRLHVFPLIGHMALARGPPEAHPRPDQRDQAEDERCPEVQGRAPRAAHDPTRLRDAPDHVQERRHR